MGCFKVQGLECNEFRGFGLGAENVGFKVQGFRSRFGYGSTYLSEPSEPEALNLWPRPQATSYTSNRSATIKIFSPLCRNCSGRPLRNPQKKLQNTPAIPSNPQGLLELPFLETEKRDGFRV